MSICKTLTQFYFILLLSCISSGRIFSQETTGGYFSFSAGTAIPVGEFARTDIEDNKSGFAALGYSFSGQFAYKFSRFGGFSVLYNYQSNPFNNAALQQAYTKKYPTVKWSVDSKPWEDHYTLLGYYNSVLIREDRRIFLDINIMGGLVNSTSAYVFVMGQQGSNLGSAVLVSTKARAFAYLIGLGMRVNLSTNVCLLIQTNYTGCTPLYNNSGGYVGAKAYSQQISNLSLTLGVAFGF